MAEMPIEQDYGRFVDPITDEEAMAEGVEVEAPEADQAEIEELPDGSAIVHMEGLEGPQEDPDFYQNLAEVIDNQTLESMALRYLDTPGIQN